MFKDAQGRKWRHRIIKPDGTIVFSNDGGPLPDGHSMSVGMMMTDAARGAGVMMTDTKVNDDLMADARQRFADTYGAGAECLAGFSERVKAQYALGDAQSNEVFRVQDAADKLRGLANRANMVAAGHSRAIFGDSADNSLAVAAFLTRQADMAQGRADALRAGQSPGVERFDPRQNQRIADARAEGGDRAVAYEIHKARLSNAWQGNRR